MHSYFLYVDMFSLLDMFSLRSNSIYFSLHSKFDMLPYGNESR